MVSCLYYRIILPWSCPESTKSYQKGMTLNLQSDSNRSQNLLKLTFKNSERKRKEGERENQKKLINKMFTSQLRFAHSKRDVNKIAYLNAVNTVVVVISFLRK